MSAAFEKLRAIREHIASLCVAGTDDYANLNAPWNALKKDRCGGNGTPRLPVLLPSRLYYEWRIRGRARRDRYEGVTRSPGFTCARRMPRRW
jgi:hypothetical protein